MPKYWKLTNMGIESDGESYEKHAKIDKLSINSDFHHYAFSLCLHEKYYG